MPIGMLGLGLLLFVRQETSSYAEAGAAAGALSLGNAVGLVAQGRLVDRYGPARVLLAGAVLCPALLVALTAAVAHHPAAPLVITLATAAGATLPATVTGMRLLWPRLVPDPPGRAAAYALLGTLFQIAMVAGPLVVSVLVLTGSAAPALLAAAALAAAGGLLFATAPAVRTWRPTTTPGRPITTPAAAAVVCAPRPAAEPSRPVAGSGMTTLVLGSLGGGAAAGMLTVALAAARPTLAGVLFASLSAGELLGGLAYGARDWALPARGRLLLSQCGMALAVAALSAATGSAWLMLLVAALIGALAAPVSIANSALLDDLVPHGSLGRAYTTMVSAGLLGMAAGSAAAGNLAGNARFTLLIAAGTLAAVFLWTLTRRRTLTGPDATARPPSGATPKCQDPRHRTLTASTPSQTPGPRCGNAQQR